MPLTIVVVLLLGSRLIRNTSWRKRFLWAGLILLFFFTNEFAANEIMKRWEVDARSFESMRSYKLGIVLTGAAIPELKPDDRVYFARGADRVIHAVQLYKLGLIENILISGGSGRLINIQEREADRFRDVMVLMGVPDSVIMVENWTRNTYESAVEVREILQEHGYKSEQCLLITSAFHMRRSMACYRNAGLKPDDFSTDFYAHNGVYYPDAFFVPKLDALIIWHKLVREWAGFAAYWVAGYV